MGIGREVASGAVVVAGIDSAVRARCDELTVELRAVTEPSEAQRLGDALAALGPWEGESTAELMSRLREPRAAGGSAEPPKL